MNTRLGLVTVLLLVAAQAWAQSKSPADAWLTGAVKYPRGSGTNMLRQDAFTTLRAEHLVEQLKVRWQPAAPLTQTRLLVHFSADAPGHWPARDWRTLPMTLRGAVWEAVLPVDDLDVPLVYFVSDAGDAPGLCSPMRVVSPRLTGMEKPSRIFWPFLDGFEAGVSGWELAAGAAAPPLKVSPQAHEGHAAMSVSLPAGERSVTVSTARVRGWHYSHQFATGLRVWLRAPAGTGRARFTLHANADTADAIAVSSTVEVELSAQWQRVELHFSSFPNFPVVATDRFSIEFRGEGPREFLVDDLRLLGRWRLPGE